MRGGRGIWGSRRAPRDAGGPGVVGDLGSSGAPRDPGGPRSPGGSECPRGLEGPGDAGGSEERGESAREPGTPDRDENGAAREAPPACTRPVAGARDPHPGTGEQSHCSWGRSAATPGKPGVT